VSAPARHPKDHDRTMRTRERLKFRVYAAVRELVMNSDLYRSRPDFFEPDIVINVYPDCVDVSTALNEGQVHLLPAEGRAVALVRFLEELRNGMQRVALSLGLELSPEGSHHGGTRPVMLLDVPIGYRAILLRKDRE